jgi:hypothetical protein
MARAPAHRAGGASLAFEEAAGVVYGSDLAAHFARAAAPTLSIVECAVALARDDAAAVHAWITSGALRRASDDEARDWPLDATRRWVALVVRPFVLVQDPPDA